MTRAKPASKGNSKPTEKPKPKKKKKSKPKGKSRRKDSIRTIFNQKQIRSLTSVVAGTLHGTKGKVTASSDWKMGIHLQRKPGACVSLKLIDFPDGITKGDVYEAVRNKHKKLQSFVDACVQGEISEVEKRYAVNDLSALPVAIDHIERLRSQPNGIHDDSTRREGLYRFIRLVAKFPMAGLNIEGLAHAASILETTVLPNWSETMGFCNIDRALVILCQQCTQRDKSNNTQCVLRTVTHDPQLEAGCSFSDINQVQHKVFTKENLHLAKSLSPICAHNAGRPPVKHSPVAPGKIEEIVRVRNG